MRITEEIINASMERIELHCHTKASGNATMYSHELLECAVMRNMPAIAITDRSNILSFPNIEDVITWKKYPIKPIYGMEMLIKDEAEDAIYSLSVLIRNETGKQNMYRIISETTADMPYTVYDKTLLMERREGLLVGSGTENGMLRHMAGDGKNDDDLRRIIAELDYVEILPYRTDRSINERIIALAEKENVPVVAVSDAHYLEKNDRRIWNIINKASHEMINRYGVHLLTTDEMLEAFSYLPEEKAKEVVIYNTHKIASACDTVRIIPENDFYPRIPDVGERLSRLCYDALDRKYGCKERDRAKNRLDLELQALDRTEMNTYFLQLKELFEKAGLSACDLLMDRGGAGSIVAYLLGISEVDPIKYDLIPERIYGKNLDRKIDIKVYVPAVAYNKTHKLIGSLESIGKAMDTHGATFSITRQNAKELVERNYTTRYVISSDEENAQLCDKVVGNYTVRNRLVTGTFLFPEGSDYRKLMPVLKYSDDREMAYYDPYLFIGKLFLAEISGNRQLEVLRSLSEMTGLDLKDIPIYSEEAMAFFRLDGNESVEGCSNLPGFDHQTVKNTVVKLKPQNIDDMVKIVAMMHGTGVWTANEEKLMDEHGIGIRELIADRDDIFDFLISKGMDRQRAFDISEYVRKGRACRRPDDYWKEAKSEMLRAGVPDWYIGSCEHIKHLCYRAEALSYTNMTMRFAWIKAHFPEEYSTVMEECVY